MTAVLVTVIRIYQVLISPLLPANSCRFFPTCSEYAVDAIRKYGPLRGSWRSLKRIGKCHPYHPGGCDPA